MRAEEEETLGARIAEFKGDPEKLREVQAFVAQLIESAERSVEARHKEEQARKLNEQRLENERAEAGGKRRFGSRARGFMARLFDALCHCSQTAAAAARQHTENLRASKR